MKKVLISILAMIFIISMAITVNAATGKISLSASSDSVLKGKTFTITIAGEADERITAMEAHLKYDTSKLAIENKQTGTGFTDMSGSDSIEIAASSNENAQKSVTLYTITFKVLDTAEEGTTEVSVSDIKLALVNEDSKQESVSVDNDSVIITIKAEGTNDNNDDNKNATGDNNSSNTNTNSTNSNNSSNKTDSTKKDTKKIAQTGINDIVLISIAALSILATIFYISYKKYNNF